MKKKAVTAMTEGGGAGPGRVLQFAEVESLAALCAFAERGPKASLPALRSVAFRGGRAAATDMVVGASVPCAGLDGLALPVAVLGAVLAAKADLAVRLDGAAVVAEAGGFRARVPVLAEGAFPDLPEPPGGGAWVALGAAAWEACLAVAAASAEEGGAGISGALLAGGWAVSTDGVRAARSALPGGCAAAGLLPARLLAAAGRAFRVTAPEAAAFDGVRAWLRFPGGAVCWCSAPVSEPPDVLGIITAKLAGAEGAPAARWDAAEASAVLGRVAPFAGDDGRVTLALGGGKAAFRASGPWGDAEESVTAECSGEVDADFGARYLTEAVRRCGAVALVDGPCAVFTGDGLVFVVMGMVR